MAKSIVKGIPYVRRLHSEINALKTELARWRTWQLPGHFYSPIPSLAEVRADAERIFRDPAPPLGGVEVNESRQLELLTKFAAYHHELPAEWSHSGRARYQFANEYYSWADGIVLYCMLRHLRPKRVVEVGSGFSSAVILDTDEFFLNNSIQCTFIDPYPERLMTLVGEKDTARVHVLERHLQNVGLEVFTSLEAGDILLVDSSHVAKTGSDVNRLVFEILPSLASGVYVHFHDVFFPFEYPQSWVEQGIAWNEAYLLHAFLQYNAAFTIQFFTSYLVQRHREVVETCLPMALKSERANPRITDAPGASLWVMRGYEERR